jgi:hypothetical protein
MAGQHYVDLPIAEQAPHADFDPRPRPICDDDLVLRHSEVELVLGEGENLGPEHVEEYQDALGLAVDENAEGHDGKILSFGRARERG